MNKPNMIYNDTFIIFIFTRIHFRTQQCLWILDHSTIDFARAIEYSKIFSRSISAPPPSSPKAVSSFLSLILQASVLQSNFLPYLYGMMMMMHAMPLVSNIKNKQNFLPPTYLSSEPIYLVSCMKYKIKFILLLIYRTISIIKINGE